MTSWIVITLYATYTVFSAGALLVIVINVVMLILLAILGKNVLSYALCFGVVIASQSTEIANRIFNPNDPRQTNEFDFEEKRFLFTYCVCFLNARGLSSALDNLTAREKKEIQSDKMKFYDKVITIAAYLLYLPGFFAGPIYLYNDFEQSTRLAKAEPKREVFLGSNYFKSMMSLFFLIITVIYYEWLLHWIYSSAVTTDYVLVDGYDSWQLSGFVFALCLLFYIKYCCIFGTFKVLATFDGLSGVPPPLPQCPASMHLSSQVWRNFDTGIYRWLKKYIYSPIAGPGSSVVSRLFATLVAFLFIGLWHLPLTPSILMWLSLNIICTFVEVWAKELGKTDFWITRIKSKLSRANYLRLIAFASLPLFTMAIQSSVFFLTDNEKIGHEFFDRILNNVNNYAIYLALVLYCGANVSIDYSRVKGNSTGCLSNPLSCYRQDTQTDAKQSKKVK